MKNVKRLLALLMAVALLCGSGITAARSLDAAAETAESYVFGDADGNEKVNTTDARRILQYAAEKITAEELLMNNADVNYDGKVNTTDARMILQHAAGMITLEPQDTHVRAMADMPGLAISPAFAVKARNAEGGSWKTIKTFAYKSDRYNHMARLTADCEVEIEITNLRGNITVYRLEPKRYEITPTVDGTTLTFKAEPMQKFAIQFSDKQTWLILAIDPPETDAPKLTDPNVVNVMDFVTDNTGKTDVYEGIDAAINYIIQTDGKDTLYFPDGIYRTHSVELNLVHNLSIYISEGARILWDENCWGSNVFRLSGCNNTRIFGRGIIDATYRVHKGRGASGIGWWDAVNLTHLSGRISNGLEVEGLWFFDTPNSPMRTEGGNNAHFYNTKYINYGGIMNDNLVVYGGSHVVFDEGIGTGDDDSWSAHTAAWGGFTSTRDVTIKNSTYIADGVEGRGGICYGCNESNPEGGTDSWNVLYENLSLIDYGEALDNYNEPTTGRYGNFIFRNVHFETVTATGKAFDSFGGLSGTIVLDNVKFECKGGTIAGNSRAPIDKLYIRNLTMAGEKITSAEQGQFKITNCNEVIWDSPDTPTGFAEGTVFAPGPVVEAPADIPVVSLPINDNFDDGTMNGWTDLSGSFYGKVNTTVVKSGEGHALQFNDLESSGVAGVIKRFTPQGEGKVVEVELDVTPTSNSQIANVYINDLVGAAVAGVRFYNNSMIRFFSTKGSNFEPGIDIMPYRANVTYHLKWVIDMSAQRYDLYIAEGEGKLVKVVGNVSFKCKLPNVASVRLDSESIWLVYTGQKTRFLADNISVKSYEADGTLFDPNDNEIHYADIAGNVKWVNNNGEGITYTGAWNYAGNRSFGDYNNDVHYTEKDGDSVTFTFTGTGVRFLSEKNTDEGEITVTLDGKPKGVVSAFAGSRAAQQIVYEVTGLENTTHTLTLTKRNGEYMLVDAFAVLTE